MASTKYLVISSVVVAALAATPLVISNSVDKEIEKNRIFLEKHGLKQEIVSKNGYVTSQRDFTLEVVDATKTRDYLLDMLVAKNAQYKIFAQSMKDIDAKSVNESFNGLKFRGTMHNSNLLPQESTMSLILDHLPHSLHAELAKEEEASKMILPLLSRGVMAFDLTFDTRQNLRSLKVRDIKEKMTIEKALLEIDTANQSLALNEEGGVVKGLITIGTQKFGVTAEDGKLLSQLENFKYGFDYKDDFNNQGFLELGKYVFDFEEPYSKVHLSLGAIKANSNAKEVGQEINLKADYTFNDIAFKSDTDTANLKNMLVTLALRGIQTPKIKKLQNDYNTLLLGANAPSDEVLIGDFVALINDGVVLDLGIALKELTGMLALKNVSIDTHVEIAKNNYTDKQSPLAIVELLDVTSKVKIHKDDRATLESLGVSVPEDFALGKEEGEFFVYDILVKKGVISVNGKPIQ